MIADFLFPESPLRLLRAFNKMEATMFLSKSSSGIWQLYYNNSLGKRTKVSTKTKNKSEALVFLKTFNLDRQPSNKNIKWEDFIQDFK